MSASVIGSFLFFLASFVLVGLYSATRRKNTTEDYLLASRDVSPWLTALSAVATSNSGYMFIGLIGWTYSVGISGMWLMVGWVSGDYLAWWFVHRRVRIRSQREGWLTIPSFLGKGLAGGGSWVIRASAVIILLFLGIYAAAQLKAGSKALHVLFGWNISSGIFIGALLVVLYCMFGGIRASIWTDALQGALMLGSMSLLLFAATLETGGFRGLWTSLAAIDPVLTDPIPQNLKFGFAAYLVGWIVAGIGVVGQPHVMVRAMAIDSADHIHRARTIYVLYYTAFSAVCIGCGLAARVLLSPGAGFDPEMALPLLSTGILPPILVGLLLAGLFAATMSTADSQILSCSAALTQDLFPRWSGSYWVAKAGTLFVTLVVLGIALGGSATVFSLVVLAWSALASALGPLLVVRAFDWPVDARTGLGMILAGLACMLFWRFGLDLSYSIYEVLPGMAGGFVCYLLLRLATRPEVVPGQVRSVSRARSDDGRSPWER
jgi:sodium/proline symporter